MACFVVPAAEALITTIAAKAVKSHEDKVASAELSAHGAAEEKLPLSKKLKALSGLLWGGSALLAFEHLWHGELSVFFPFLTAASDPEAASVMLSEMATVGTAMAAAVTAVWGAALAVIGAKRRKALPETKQEDAS